MLQEIYPYFIKFHIVFSVCFLLIAIGISLYSLWGWQKKLQYGSFENHFRKTFLVLLYLDLVLGIILYFFLKKPQDLITADEAMKFFNLRFWAIQHFSNMIFVAILSTIGNLFIKKAITDFIKYKYSFLYFGISTLITIVSVGMFALRK